MSLRWTTYPIIWPSSCTHLLAQSSADCGYPGLLDDEIDHANAADYSHGTTSFTTWTNQQTDSRTHGQNDARGKSVICQRISFGLKTQTCAINSRVTLYADSLYSIISERASRLINIIVCSNFQHNVLNIVYMNSIRVDQLSGRSLLYRVHMEPDAQHPVPCDVLSAY